MTQFTDLKLDPKVLKAIEEAGYTTPTPIQAGAIPPALEGRDVLGIAQTGTGKTASFTLPMITLLGRGRARARMPRSLVLCPTRELAAQVAENFDTYAKHTRLTKALLIGGVSMRDQEQLIDRGVDVLIATPGRLLDHFERGNLLLQGVQIMVVDEADRMLDMGFIPDIERIFQLTPFSRQTLFFSATMAPEIERITNTFLHTPVRIEVARQATTSETITQKLVELAPTRKDQTAKQKRELLRALIGAEGDSLKNAIIFCNRKTEVDIVAKSLKAHGYDAAPIHGDLEQRQRMATLDGFRDGTLRFLIASDVAARGLDIPAVSHVFNFDLPSHAEDYVHRIGRTGRAGRLGTAISIGTPSDDKYLSAIEALVKQSLPRAELPEGFSLSDDAQRAPREMRDAGREGSREGGRGGSSRSRTRSRRGEPRRDEAGRETGHEERRAVNASGDENGLPPAIETVTEGGRVDLPESRAPRGERRRDDRREDRGGERREDRREDRGGERRDDQRGGRSENRGDGRHDGTNGDGRNDGRGSRDERRDRYRDRDRGPSVLGMGEHVPDFMLTSFRSFVTAPGDEQPAEPANQPKVEAAVGPTAIPTPAEPPVQAQPQEPAPDDAKATGPADAEAPAERKKPARRARSRKADASAEVAAEAAAVTDDAAQANAPPAADAAETPAPKRRTRSRKTAEPAAEGPAEADTDTPAKPKRAPRTRKKKDADTDVPAGDAADAAALSDRGASAPVPADDPAQG